MQYNRDWVLSTLTFGLHSLAACRCHCSNCIILTVTCSVCILFPPENAIVALHVISIHKFGLHSVSTWRRYLSYCMLSTFTSSGCILFLPGDATCRIACYQHSQVRVAFCFYLETLLVVLHAINIHKFGLHSVSTWRRYLSYCMLHVSAFTCSGCILFLPGDATCRIACYQHLHLRFAFCFYLQMLLVVFHVINSHVFGLHSHRKK